MITAQEKLMNFWSWERVVFEALHRVLSMKSPLQVGRVTNHERVESQPNYHADETANPSK